MRRTENIRYPLSSRGGYMAMVTGRMSFQLSYLTYESFVHKPYFSCKIFNGFKIMKYLEMIA